LDLESECRRADPLEIAPMTSDRQAAENRIEFLIRKYAEEEAWNAIARQNCEVWFELGELKELCRKYHRTIYSYLPDVTDEMIYAPAQVFASKPGRLRYQPGSPMYWMTPDWITYFAMAFEGLCKRFLVPEGGSDGDDAEDNVPAGSGRVPASAIALRQYLSAEEFLMLQEGGADRVTDNDAYAWLERNGQPDEELPERDTWKRYLRAGRNATGSQKNKPRLAGQSRSVVRPGEI